jgi:Ni2+-binding GTPase involved in maturation of urease and hydrogenase
LKPHGAEHATELVLLFVRAPMVLIESVGNICCV